MSVLIITPRVHVRSRVKQSVLSVCNLLYVYLTEVKGASFRCILAISYFHNIGSTSSWPQSPIKNRTRGNFMLRDDR